MRVIRASDTDHITSRLPACAPRAEGAQEAPPADAPRLEAPSRFFTAFASLTFALCAICLGGTAGANTSNGYNLPVGVTSLSESMYALHMEVFWICVGIAVVVFGAMIYSLLKFRRSQGAVADTTMVHSTKVEIIWTIIPVIILVVMAVPAADLILKQEDTRNSELTVRVTGYQWKWQYQYMNAGEGIGFFSTLKQDSNFARQLDSGINPKDVPNYLLEVDKPLVIPSGTKVRLLLTSMDVIHAWWVPDFGAKRSALPGFVNELWFKVDAGKEGIYRGQCAALCGRDHAFMPVVVDVRTPDDFKKWVDEQKAALKQAATPPAAAPAGTSTAGASTAGTPAAGLPVAATPGTPATGVPVAATPGASPAVSLGGALAAPVAAATPPIARALN